MADQYKQYKEARKILSKVFKTEPLCVGGTLDGVEIDDFWYASISNFHPRESLLVAVVHTEKWKKGILWIPDVVSASVSNVAAEVSSGKAVVLNLPDWDDPVIEALHDVDMVPGKGALRLGDNASYYLHIETEFFDGSISYAGASRNPKLRKLWAALAETVYFFTEMSQDPFIEAWVDNNYGYTRYKFMKQGDIRTQRNE